VLSIIQKTRVKLNKCTSIFLFFLLQIDLAAVTGLVSSYYSSFLIIREIVGPFYNETIVSIILLLLQSLFFNLLACIVSLKIFLVFTIVYAPAVSEWNEKIIVLIHRLFVLVVGFGTGGLICQAGGAMCRQAPLKLYLLNANNGAIPEYKGSLLTNLTMFAFVSVHCLPDTD
jgi:hypothetical protein